MKPERDFRQLDILLVGAGATFGLLIMLLPEAGLLRWLALPALLVPEPLLRSRRRRTSAAAMLRAAVALLVGAMLLLGSDAAPAAAFWLAFVAVAYPLLPAPRLAPAVIVPASLLLGAAWATGRLTTGAAVGPLFITLFGGAAAWLSTRSMARLARENSALQQDSQLLEAVVGASPLAIDVIDTEGRVLLWNPAAEALFGYRADEVIGRRLPIIPPELEAEFKTQRSRETAQPLRIDHTRRLRKDGGRVDVRLLSVPLRDPDGQVVGSAAIVEDVGAARRAARAPHESESRFQNLLRSLDDVVWAATLDQAQMVYLNPAAEALYGRPLAELLRNPRLRYEAIHPAEGLTFETLQQELETRGDFEREYRIRRPDGQVRWVRDRTYVVYDGGEPGYVGGIIADITPRKRIEQALFRERQLLSGIVNTSVAAIVVVSLEGRIIFANESAEGVLGRSREALMNLAHDDPGWIMGDLQGNPLPEEEIPFARVLASDEPVVDARHTIRWPSGEQRLLSVNGAPLRDSLGQIQGVVFTVRDLTEREQAESMLRRQERLAAVGQLAAGIAHDFNNVLSGISMNAEMVMLTEGLEDRARTRLEIIMQQSTQAAQLISQILEYSRRSVLERRRVDLLQPLGDLVNVLQHTLPETIRLRLSHLPGEYVVLGDHTRLQQLFMNLVVNARDAMPAGGSIEIEIQRLTVGVEATPPDPEMKPGSWIRIAVIDDGQGMPAEVQKHVFEPFFTTKGPEKGTGLGLAQVYAIVKEHEGVVRVISEPGEGTRIDIFLPAHADSATAESNAALAYGSGETVLLLESGEGSRMALRSSLQQLNYDVLEAADGHEALRLVADQARPVDVVLMDLWMPGPGALPFLRALRQAGATVPVVVTTSYALDEELAQLQALGVAAWLFKPVLLRPLASVLAEALAGRPPAG